MSGARRRCLHPDEEAIIRHFVSRYRREQFLRRIRMGDPDTRESIRGILYHFDEFAPDVASRILPRLQTVDIIYELLKEKGAPDMCHIMSTDDRLDGRDMDLREALNQTVGFAGGTFVSCIRGKLAYFEGESPSERYILQRDLPAALQSNQTTGDVRKGKRWR